MTPRAGGFFVVLSLAREFLLHILRFHTVVARVQIRLEHGVAHGRVPGRTPPTESGRGSCLEETTKEGQGCHGRWKKKEEAPRRILIF